MTQRYILKVNKVLTMNAVDDVLVNQGLWIEDGKIKALDHWSHFATGDLEVVDASTSTVLPGLIDAHTHVTHSGDPGEDWRFAGLSVSAASSALKAAFNAQRQLDMGVTTIRDLGARDGVDLALRDAISEGWQRGPRMLVAGQGITSSGGHMDSRKFLRPDLPLDSLASIGSMGAVADSPFEAKAAAWRQLMFGADLLKLNATLSEYVRASGGECSPELSFEAMKTICDLAHSTNRKVAAHCHGGPGVQAAIDAGVDSFEHGRFLTDRHLEQLAQKQAFLVPTLSPEARRVEADDPPQDAATRSWYQKATQVMYQTVAKAKAHGVLIVAGTDAGMPYVYHGSIAYEMQQLAHAGLGTMPALASATRLAAEALGLGQQVGQIQAGYSADLLVIEGDPSQDLQLLQRQEALVAVIQAGRMVRRKELEVLGED